MKPWSIEECEAYAEQLRDKSKANTAEHAAQAIDFLLGLVKQDWVGLTDAEKQEWIDAMPYDPEPRHCMILVNVIEAKLKEKNA